MKNLIKIGIGCLVFVSPGSAQSTLSDLSWLEGTWRQESEGRSVEVRWNAPIGDAMVGTFREVRDGHTAMYEVLTLRETSDGIEYRFDLFDAKDEFSAGRPTRFGLIEVDDGRAVFRHEQAPLILTIEISDQGRLMGWMIDENEPDRRMVGYDASRVGG